MINSFNDKPFFKDLVYYKKIYLKLKNFIIKLKKKPGDAAKIAMQSDALFIAQI